MIFVFLYSFLEGQFQCLYLKEKKKNRKKDVNLYHSLGLHRIIIICHTTVCQAQELPYLEGIPNPFFDTFTGRLKHVLWNVAAWVEACQLFHSIFKLYLSISELELKNNISSLCFKSLINSGPLGPVCVCEGGGGGGGGVGERNRRTTLLPTGLQQNCSFISILPLLANYYC